MTEFEKQKVWIVLDHPQQFATALGIVSYLDRNKFIFILLISYHPYWKKVDINLYKHQFDEVHFLERPDYTSNPIGLLKMIFQIFRLRKIITQFKIHPNDIIIGLSVFHYLENIVVSMNPKSLKVAFMPLVVYQECIREMDMNIYRNTLEGWLANWIVEPITRLHRTYCMKERRYPKAYWWIRYRESLLDIFDKVIILGDFSSEKSYFEDNILTMPYPYVLTLKKKRNEENKSNKKSQKIVVFGTDFRGGMYNITPDIYATNLNKCLSFLREKYSMTHKLVYRPHPNEKDEIKLLNLDQFEIENDGMLSELYFYSFYQDVYAAFSVESTSSRSAYDFFINAYAFLDIFPYYKEIKNFFKLTMGNVPNDFYINDLSMMPNRYIHSKDITIEMKTCTDALDNIFKKNEKEATPCTNPNK